ncbi:unnamed protein product [Symbiodinium sp. CCMP2456]|nr:unnamed protein product [Symbiodinium sp. CCMP2456]
MIAKRPASVKTSAWNKEILTATDRGILDMLRKDKLIGDWSEATCPRCNVGKLGGLITRPNSEYFAHRCNRKNCQCYVSPLQLHPLFTQTMGQQGVSLQKQAAALLLRLVNVPLADIHLLTNVNHKALEKLNKNLLYLRKGYVHETEKSIRFGGSTRSWKDVEVDEATFDKKTLEAGQISEADASKGKKVQWEQWGGLVQRGDPKTLVLARLNPAITVPRAPGPGAMRKTDWKPLATKWLKNRSVVLHSDSARSYKMKVPGMVHDSVVHKKKRVKLNGKWVWKPPTYVRTTTHKLPGGRKLKTKAGTQIVDRAWRFIKDRLRRNQAAKTGSTMLAAQIRSAQYEYWHRKDDLWLCTGELVAWYMKDLLAIK